MKASMRVSSLVSSCPSKVNFRHGIPLCSLWNFSNTALTAVPGMQWKGIIFTIPSKFSSIYSTALPILRTGSPLYESWIYGFPFKINFFIELSLNRLVAHFLNGREILYSLYFCTISVIISTVYPPRSFSLLHSALRQWAI